MTKRCLLTALCALSFIPPIHASVVGLLALGSGGSVTATLTSIRFGPDPTSTPVGLGTPAAPWDAQVATPTALHFAGCAGALGSAGCLNSGPLPAEAVEINQDIALSAATTLPEDQFFRFGGDGLTHADLDYVLSLVGPGSLNSNCGALAQFQSCSVYAGSPVVLTLLGSNTIASLGLSGTVTDGVGPASTWVGSFSVTFPGETPGDIQRIFCPSGTCTAADFQRQTAITTSVSGTFEATATPEPGSLALLLSGLGLIVVGAARRRRK